MSADRTVNGVHNPGANGVLPTLNGVSNGHISPDISGQKHEPFQPAAAQPGIAVSPAEEPSIVPAQSQADALHSSTPPVQTVPPTSTVHPTQASRQAVPSAPTFDSPPADEKISETPSSPTHTVKKRRLVKKVKPPPPIMEYLWLGGHGVSIFFGAISILYLSTFSNSIIGKVSYRLSFLGSIVALVVSALSKFGFTFPSPSTLLASENFQYILLGATWFFTYKSPLKLLPFFSVSLLQISSFYKVKMIVDEGVFIGKLIAYDELLLMIVLLVRTLFFRTTSGFQLVLFGMFYWIRILYSSDTQNLFTLLMSKLDSRIPKTNPKVVHIWEKTKSTLEQKRKQNGTSD